MKWLDPGWLFLVVGVTLVGAGLLIPAADDLDEAVWRRDRVLAVETAQQETLSNYASALRAAREDDPRFLEQAAIRELNLAPESATFFERPPESGYLAAMRHEPATLPTRNKLDSTLSRLALGDSSRLWLFGFGAVALLIGLLPASVGGSDGDPDESPLDRRSSVDDAEEAVDLEAEHEEAPDDEEWAEDEWEDSEEEEEEDAEESWDDESWSEEEDWDDASEDDEELEEDEEDWEEAAEHETEFVADVEDDESEEEEETFEEDEAEDDEQMLLFSK